jgi:hypothetical protein
LAVERLMLPELLEQDHRQQAGPGPAPRQHMEGCRRLADRLAIAAAELLADTLDHFPLPRDHFQRFGDVFAEFAQPGAATAWALRRRRFDHPLARQVRRERLTCRVFAGKARHCRRLGNGPLGGDLVLAGGALEFLEGQLHLLDELLAAFRALAIELVRQLGDLQPLMGDQGRIVGGLGLGHREFRLDPRRPRRFRQALFALREQGRPQYGDVVGEDLGHRHERDYRMPSMPQSASATG